MNPIPAQRPQIHRNSRLMPLLVGVLGVMLLAYPHEVWLIGLLTLGGVWLVSYRWAIGLARGLHLARQIRFGWAQVGDRLEEQFTLTHQGWLPALWVEVLDQSTLPDYQPGRVTGVGSQTVNRWKTDGVCTRRGVFTLGPTILRSGDPFRLYTVTVYQPDSTTLTVTPPVVPLPTIEVAPGGRAGEGRPHPNALERTIDAATVRPYHPGDARQAIHWPTSARRDALFVRRFETTPAGDWWLVLDVDEQVQAGQGANTTLEHGIILAASLADRGLRAGRGVGLLAYGQTLTWLPPKQGDAQRWQILRALATVTTGSHPLAELLAQPNFGRLASLIIITPNTGSQWIERLPTLLGAKAVATVLLLDPLAFGGSADPAPTLTLLSTLHISHYRITPDLLDRAEQQPGHQGEWAWRISPLGRAVSVRSPQELEWKALG